MDNPNAINPKVAAASATGAISTIVVFALGRAGIEVSPEIASAVTLLLMAAAGYLKKS